MNQRRFSRMLPAAIVAAAALVPVASQAEPLKVARRANGSFVISNLGDPKPLRPVGDDSSYLIARRNRPTPFDPAIQSAAAEFGLDPLLLKCVTLVESGFNPMAVSNKGAQGLMQLMPKTAAAYGVTNAFDPVQNLRGGARYLNFLLTLFRGDLNLALAGYNAVEGAVAKYGRVPPYDETQNYVRKILTAFNGTPALSGGKFRTALYRPVDIRKDPGRPLFAWVDNGGRTVLSAQRPPQAHRPLVRLASGR